jgi:ribosome-associated protein
MENERFETQGRGRSAKKREAKEVAKLVVQLVDLPEAAVASLPLDERLHEKLMQLRRTRGHSSKKREHKHFASLLRADTETCENLQVAMSQRGRVHGQETANHKDLEELRVRLCSEEEQDAALQEVATNFPSVDVKALQRLLKSVRNGRDKRAYREIFRRLREGKEASAVE